MKSITALDIYLKGKTTMRQLAYKYGVSESTVYRVAKGNLS